MVESFMLKIPTLKVPTVWSSYGWKFLRFNIIQVQNPTIRSGQMIRWDDSLAWAIRRNFEPQELWNHGFFHCRYSVPCCRSFDHMNFVNSTSFTNRTPTGQKGKSETCTVDCTSIAKLPVFQLQQICSLSVMQVLEHFFWIIWCGHEAWMENGHQNEHAKCTSMMNK